MLVRTFLHFHKVGERRERALWRFGYIDWNSILSRPAPSFWIHFWDEWRREAEASLKALGESNASYFSQRLPKPFWWRVVPEFADRTVFLDVETDGTNRITVLGVANWSQYFVFVRGIEDMDEARERIESAAVVVTYNGSGFDLPVLRENFPDWRLPPFHLDLCPLLRRLGYKGGLKVVEAQIGIKRSPKTQGLNGWDAVRLWWQWRDYGDDKALNLLLAYNREDVVNLRPLLEFAYQRLWTMTVEEAPEIGILGK
ncbi:MAG: ribonuclease H-like domain-containing protein [Armatimonadota bacterium]|nr:ribonuclease H-like domain-containing protein [Armatimonadota bacterium]MDW8144494.1 ribonuclease H-like domain-containing protein [Armatimonadota bacterium]